MAIGARNVAQVHWLCFQVQASSSLLSSSTSSSSNSPNLLPRERENQSQFVVSSSIQPHQQPYQQPLNWPELKRQEVGLAGSGAKCVCKRPMNSFMVLSKASGWMDGWLDGTMLKLANFFSQQGNLLSQDEERLAFYCCASPSTSTSTRLANRLQPNVDQRGREFAGFSCQLPMPRPHNIGLQHHHHHHHHSLTLAIYPTI